jgi:hypothetical protein
MRIGLRRYLFACTGNRGISPGRLYPWPAIPPGLVRLLQKNCTGQRIYGVLREGILYYGMFWHIPASVYSARTSAPARLHGSSGKQQKFLPLAERLPPQREYGQMLPPSCSERKRAFLQMTVPQTLRKMSGFVFLELRVRIPVGFSPAPRFFYPCAGVVCPVKGRPCSRYSRSSR